MPSKRSALAAPGSARLVGAVVALAGVALLIFGVVALGGGGGDGPAGAAPAPTVTGTVGPPASATSPGPATTSSPAASSPSAVPSEGTGVGSEPAPTTPPEPTRTSAARAPLTVLNNSTISGLADRAAREAQGQGWVVAQVGNFAGRLPATTVYYTPGNAAQEAAARELAREFPHVEQVLPRYAGLPPTPDGIVLVVTKDWS